MKRFAQIDNEIVTALLTAPEAPTEVPAGRSFVELGNDQVVGHGDRYDAGTQTFTRQGPRPLPPPQPTMSELKALLESIAAKVGVAPKTP
jgi:hypothetical protein